MDEKEAISLGEKIGRSLAMNYNHEVSKLIDMTSIAAVSEYEFTKFLFRTALAGGSLPNKDEIYELMKNEKLRIAFLVGLLSAMDKAFGGEDDEQ